MSLPRPWKNSYEETNSIYLAIKSRNAKKAREAARRHVVNARSAAKKAFEKTEPPANSKPSRARKIGNFEATTAN
jgi:DNA-binding GntR family transcriptional regulator